MYLVAKSLIWSEAEGHLVVIELEFVVIEIELSS